MEIKFNEKNFIKSYQFYAFPLGIIATNEELYKKWLLGRFIGVCCGEVLQYDEQSYEEWSIIEENLYKELDMHFINQQIINIIDRGEVLHLWGVNEKYLLGSSAYGKYDYIHDLLVVGYDKHDNLSIVNYGADRILSRKTISIKSLKDSLTRYTQGRSFKINENKFKIMTFEEITNNIREYINPIQKNKLRFYDKNINPNSEMLVGIFAVEEFLQKLKTNFDKDDYINSICLLNEHKIIMMNTLTYLFEKEIIHKEIIKEYEKVLTLSAIIKKQYIKFLVGPTKKIQEGVIENLELMIRKEREVLNRLFYL